MWAGLYYNLASTPKIYVGSHEPDQALCEKHVPKLVEAFENCKIDEMNLILKLLLRARARQHQYEVKIGRKTKRFLDWGSELERDNEHLDYLTIMKPSAVIFNIKDESWEAHKNELLSLENAGLEHEFGLVDRGEVSRADLVNTARCAFSIVGEKVPDPERGGEQVWQGWTQASRRRREATRAVLGQNGRGGQAPTCLEVAADALEVARAMAGDGATLAGAALGAVARALDAAAKDLDAAPRRTDKQEDAHMMYRAAECCWRAAVAVAEADDDDAATHARALCVAAKAVDAAAKRVVADVEFDVKLAARRDLAAAEAAFESLYHPAKARRPRPTSRAVRLRPISRRRVAGEARVASEARVAEYAMWHMRGLPRRGVRRVQVLPRHVKARRPEHLEEVLREAGVFSAGGAPPASHFSRRANASDPPVWCRRARSRDGHGVPGRRASGRRRCVAGLGPRRRRARRAPRRQARGHRSAAKPAAPSRVGGGAAYVASSGAGRSGADARRADAPGAAVGGPGPRRL